MRSVITCIGYLKRKAVCYWTAANSNAWFSAFNLLVFVAVSSCLMV